MGSDRERNDGGSRKAAGFSPSYHGRSHGAQRHGPRDDPAGWLWGWHAVEAALDNPQRPAPQRLLTTPDRGKMVSARWRTLKPEIVEAGDISRHLPPAAVHQGIALRTPPLEGVSLEEILGPSELAPQGLIVVLDQVTDPQNVGAILRSAAAFGARGVVMQDRHAPALGGALAKAAAGALEKVAVVRAVNLSRALETLGERGWTSVGLDGEAEVMLRNAVNQEAVVIVMGSEGEGLRRLVSEHCDILAKIEMPGGFDSLNVSSAAAIACYEATRRMGARATGE